MSLTAKAGTRGRASPAIHHERQGNTQLCGLHAVNALLQHEFGDHFSQKDMDALCLELDPPRCCHLNQHRAWTGMGDYDVNVLLYALAKRGLDGDWHDARVPASRMDLTNVVGLLVNGGGGGGGGGGALSPFGSGNHWYAIRAIEGDFWNLNSLNRSPRRFLDDGEMLNDLSKILASGGAVIRITHLSAGAGGSCRGWCTLRA